MTEITVALVTIGLENMIYILRVFLRYFSLKGLQLEINIFFGEMVL